MPFFTKQNSCFKKQNPKPNKQKAAKKKNQPQQKNPDRKIPKAKQNQTPTKFTKGESPGFKEEAA